MENLKTYRTTQLISKVLETGEKVLYLINEDIRGWKMPDIDYTQLNNGKELMLHTDVLIEQSPVPTTLIKVSQVDYSLNKKELYTVKEIKKKDIVTELHEVHLTGEYDIVVQELTKEWVLEFPSGRDLKKVLAKDYYQPLGARTGRVPIQGKPRPIISDNIDEQDINNAQDKDAASRRATNFMIQSEQAHTHGVTGAIHGEALVFAYRSLIDEGKNVLHLTSSYETKGILSKWLSLHAQEKFEIKVPANSILSNFRNGGRTELISKTKRDLFTHKDYGRLDLELNYEFETIEDITEGHEHAWESSEHRRDGDRCKYDIVLLDDKVVKIY